MHNRALVIMLKIPLGKNTSIHEKKDGKKDGDKGRNWRH